MKKCFILIFFLLVLILSACSEQNVEKQSDFSVSLRHPDIAPADGGIIFHYQIVNNQKENITFSFPSSQEYDYIIYNEKGEKVTQYSSELMFADVIVEKTLKTDESLFYTVEITNLPKGKYTMDIWLTSNYEDDFKQSVSFEIR